MNGIIVGLDGSPSAACELRWSGEHAALRRERVTALLAWTFVDQHNLAPEPRYDPDYEEADAALALEELISRAVGANAAVARRVVCDLAAPALLDAAADASLGPCSVP